MLGKKIQQLIPKLFFHIERNYSCLDFSLVNSILIAWGFLVGERNLEF